MDMCILYRTNHSSRVLEEKLIEYEIPYRIIGGLKFYQRAEIKNISAYLKFLGNPKDITSFMRLLNYPKRGIGSISQVKIQTYLEQQEMNTALFLKENNSFLQTLSPKIRKALSQLTQEIQYLREKVPSLKISEIVENIIHTFSIKEAIKSLSDSIEREKKLDHLHQFVNMIYDYEERWKDHSLEDFLAHLSLSLEENQVESLDYVYLMSIHSAKGLEFPVVFISGMVDGIFPHQWSIEEENIEEERRLFYVAITRAMERLYISTYFYSRSYGQYKECEASRFLEEIRESNALSTPKSDNHTYF